MFSFFGRREIMSKRHLGESDKTIGTSLNRADRLRQCVLVGASRLWGAVNRKRKSSLNAHRVEFLRCS